MNIPFIDLKKQFQIMEPDIRSAIDEVLAHGQFIMGPEIGRLEAGLARAAGVTHAIGCGSGTDALLMALMAYGVGSGDAVFTCPFTFVATAEVISLLGAVPVFVDMDPRTYNIDPEKLADAAAEAVKKGRLRPAGVIPVDLFGLPADYEAVNPIARQYDMFVLEDAAQSFGGVYHGRAAGGLGDVGATSFFPAKPLGCYGDGGAIFTNDDGLAEVMRSIRVHGQGRHKYENVRLGLNARLDTIQAAVLLVKLAALPGEIQARQKVAEKYTALLEGRVTTPHVPEGLVSAWAQYSVQVGDREAVQAALKEAGIPTAVYYPLPLHLQKAYADLGYGQGDFPAAEAAAKRIFSLPMHPYLEDEQIEFIAGRVRAAVDQGD